LFYRSYLFLLFCKKKIQPYILLLYLLHLKNTCMPKYFSILLIATSFSVFQTHAIAQDSVSATTVGLRISLPDSTKKDTLVYSPFKDLPLKPEREIKFTTSEGTWISVDISPDGQTIAFDLMGDIYTMPSTGGKATRTTTGIAYEIHPRFSPDGKKILFTSDRTGSDNIWYIDMEKKDTIQLTKDKTEDYPSAVWTPDGEYIIASRGRRLPKLWMYHKDGGGGIQLNEQPIAIKTIDPFVGADGNTVYFSMRQGSWNYNALLPQYQIGTYDRKKGQLNTITTRYGSAFTPTLSKDGQWLVFGSRYEDKTGLVIRNLKNGDEKWLAYPV
jgi:Tol biopolymer transport system component